MNIPEKVKIGNHEYSVSFEPDLDDGDSYALIRHLHKTIKIHAGVPQTQKEESFIHEVVEAFDDALHLELDHGKLKVLGGALYRFIVENPKMFMVGKKLEAE